MAMASGYTVVDDTDTNIRYTCTGADDQSWIGGGLQGKEYNGTTHGTSSAGCKLIYTFTGNFVGVYGTVPGYHDSAPSAGATSRYFIDNSTSPSSVLTSTPTQDTVFQQPFFQSSYLADGTHSLTVTLAEDSVVDGTAGYWIDFFIVGPPGISTSAQTTSTSNSPSVLPSTKSDPNRNSSVPIGPIVGGIVGGVAFLLVLSGLVSFYFLRRRQNRHRSLGSFDSLSRWSVFSTSTNRTPSIFSFLSTSDGQTSSQMRPSSMRTAPERGLVLNNYSHRAEPPPSTLASSPWRSTLDSLNSSHSLSNSNHVVNNQSQRHPILGLRPGDSVGVHADPRHSSPPATASAAPPYSALTHDHASWTSHHFPPPNI